MCTAGVLAHLFVVGLGKLAASCLRVVLYRETIRLNGSLAVAELLFRVSHGHLLGAIVCVQRTTVVKVCATSQAYFRERAVTAGGFAYVLALVCSSGPEIKTQSNEQPGGARLSSSVYHGFG